MQLLGIDPLTLGSEALSLTHVAMVAADDWRLNPQSVSPLAPKDLPWLSLSPPLASGSMLFCWISI